jgi:hypothetical protein
VTLIGLLGLLALGAAVTGAALRTGELAIGGAMAVVRLACGLLCGVAEDACHGLGRPRR